MPRPMPEGMFDPMPAVTATFDDGSIKTLFEFYPDEISFSRKELCQNTIIGAAPTAAMKIVQLARRSGH